MRRKELLGPLLRFQRVSPPPDSVEQFRTNQLKDKMQSHMCLEEHEAKSQTETAGACHGYSCPSSPRASAASRAVGPARVAGIFGVQRLYNGMTQGAERGR